MCRARYYHIFCLSCYSRTLDHITGNTGLLSDFKHSNNLLHAKIYLLSLFPYHSTERHKFEHPQLSNQSGRGFDTKYWNFFLPNKISPKKKMVSNFHYHNKSVSKPKVDSAMKVMSSAHTKLVQDGHV